MGRAGWQFNPDSGGKKIPDTLKPEIERRLRQHAEATLAGRYARLEIRFRGQFCYIDAYTEPDVPENWPPPDWGIPREAYIERLRATPTHLCRLRYFGDMERWGFAFYTYSNEKYEFAAFPSGDFLGSPEEALETAAGVYLH